VIENRFLLIARACVGGPYKVTGFLIDPEMYLLDSAKPSLPDFGDFAMSQFVSATGVRLDYASLNIGDRKRLLQNRKLIERYSEFQFDQVKTMAMRTRERLQELHPGAILGFFMWRKNDWFKAVAAGFATQETPCFVGPELTYNGGYSVLFKKYRDVVKEQAGVPVLFVPGIDLSLERIEEQGAVLKGNLYHRTVESDGYFIWSLARCFENRPPEPAMQFLSEVNKEISRYVDSQGTYRTSWRSRSFPIGELKALLALQ
jgi:hypothetical protein